jgi:hypothetical protein
MEKWFVKNSLDINTATIFFRTDDTSWNHKKSCVLIAQAQIGANKEIYE